jgi:hypothetical protein
MDDVARANAERRVSMVIGDFGGGNRPRLLAVLA